jgi:hypothetical protein
VGSIASTLVLAGVVSDDGTGLTALLGVCAASMGVAVIAATRLPDRPGSARPSEAGAAEGGTLPRQDVS